MFGELLDDDEAVDELEPELGVELLDVEEREELLLLVELEFDEVLLLLPLLLERSSLRRSSLRRSSLPRERLLRQSPRPRSPNRPRYPSRSRSRRSSRLLLSDLEPLPPSC
jgi:hypothetical protein